MASATQTGHTSGGHPRPETVFVSYVSADQMWAEWVSEELRRAGCIVETADWDSASDVDLLSDLERAHGRFNRYLAIVSSPYLPPSLPPQPPPLPPPTRSSP